MSPAIFNSSHTPASRDAQRARFELRDVRLRRVLAFTGVAPLGAFLVVHTITTSTALYGSARFGRIFGNPTRAMTWLTLLFVLLPLAFHALYGTYIALAKNVGIGAPFFLPRLRRAATIVTLLFLAFHMSDVSARVWTHRVDTGALHELLVAQLSSTFLGFPLRAVLYVVGIAAAAFHTATSLWTFCTTWGITPTFRAQRVSAWGFGILGALLFVMGANTIVYFATGSRIVFFDPHPHSHEPHVESLDGVLPHSPCPQPEK